MLNEKQTSLLSNRKFKRKSLKCLSCRVVVVLLVAYLLHFFVVNTQFKKYPNLIYLISINTFILYILYILYISFIYILNYLIYSIKNTIIKVICQAIIFSSIYWKS